MLGAHRAGTDVDGVVDILYDTRVMEKMMTVPSAIPIRAWLEHSNHSRARKYWEEKMMAEIEAENNEVLAAGVAIEDMEDTGIGGVVSPAIVVERGASAGRGDEGDSDESEMSIAENDMN